MKERIYYHSVSQFEHMLKMPTHKMPLKEFLNNCTTCGGNWAAMFMSGIKECFPELYDSLPDATIDGFALMDLVSRITEQ